MNVLAILKLTKLDDATVQRIGDVLVTAAQAGDLGVVAWANRAVADAKMLGRLRDKDNETLNRLERNYSGQYDYGRGCSCGDYSRLQAA
jgi:hypothetical protein